MTSTRSPTLTGAQALDRALDLFARVVEDEGHSSLAMLARNAGMPLSTAHRMLGRFEARGLIVRVARGRYRAGLEFARLQDHAALSPTLARIARPPMRSLAQASGRTLHLGILEAEMVTYLVKEANGAPAIFTREAMQLEAYCSAIGKILLADLADTDLAAYLANGPFVGLTPRTLTDPHALRDHLLMVRRIGYAIDDHEIDDNVWCLAVPIRYPQGKVVAALSSSGSKSLSPRERRTLLVQLKTAARVIEDRLAPATARGRPSL